jgi:hypothetical protein
MYTFKLTVPFALVHYSFLKNTRGPLAWSKIILYTIQELKFLNRSTHLSSRKRSLGLRVTYTSPWLT